MCRTHYVATITQSLYLIGTLCAFLTEVIVDKYGRRKTSVIFILTLISTAVVSQSLMSDVKMLSVKVSLAFKPSPICISIIYKPMDLLFCRAPRLSSSSIQWCSRSSASSCTVWAARHIYIWSSWQPATTIASSRMQMSCSTSRERWPHWASTTSH